MLIGAEVEKVYLACGSTDMRKSIDGLAAIVQVSFSLDPFSTCFFIFCNKNKNKLKILHWQQNGFWLYYCRLEKGNFQWPKHSNSYPLEVSIRELGWLLDGLSLEQKKAHPKVASKAGI